MAGCCPPLFNYDTHTRTKKKNYGKNHINMKKNNLILKKILPKTIVPPNKIGNKLFLHILIIKLH